MLDEPAYLFFKLFSRAFSHCVLSQHLDRHKEIIYHEAVEIPLFFALGVFCHLLRKITEESGALWNMMKCGE